jgi:hypothetical protein
MKTNLDSLFKGDKQTESDGVWFEVSEGVKFRVKRMGGNNQAEVAKATTKYYTPYAKLIEKNLMPLEKVAKITAKIFVDSCLIDWEGVEIDGQEAPFSKETAVAFFTELPDLLTVLMDYAGSVESFREDLGNS